MHEVTLDADCVVQLRAKEDDRISAKYFHRDSGYKKFYGYKNVDVPKILTYIP